MNDVIPVMWIKPCWIDASALLKALVDEGPGSERMRALLSDTRVTRLTSWLCVGEAYGKLKTLCLGKTKSITQDEYHRKLYELRAWIRERKIDVQLGWLGQDRDPADAAEIARFSAQFKIDFCDAAQIFEFERGILAAAKNESTPLLVTNDGPMIKAAESKGIKVWDPDKGDLTL